MQQGFLVFWEYEKRRHVGKFKDWEHQRDSKQSNRSGDEQQAVGSWALWICNWDIFWTNIFTNWWIFKFEIESSSSSSSCVSGYKGSEPNLILAFGMEPRRYNWGPIGFPKTDPEKKRSGGSSRASSNSGSQSPLNWSHMVEKIFREEIGKMTECFPKGACHGMNWYLYQMFCFIKPSFSWKF